MELKVICQCGQKYKFDVEPVGGKMPFAVNCPVCKLDGTVKANEMLAHRYAAPPMPPVAPQAVTASGPPPPVAPASAVPPPIFAPVPAVPPPPPMVAFPAGGLRVNSTASEPATASAPPLLAPMGGRTAPPPISGMRSAQEEKKLKAKESGQFSLARGIMGAVIGAVVGCGLMLGFWMWAQFRFPLMGIAVGVTSGYGARWLARGTDSTLGIITAVIAGASVTGTFVIMYGGFALFNIISIVICAGVAYRASSE